jgi:uncharacterized membrane protein HdeD (DUF308 family)
MASLGKWFTATAVLFIILGIMAIAEPMVAGLAVAILTGWLFLLAGGVHVAEAFGGGLGRALWQLVLGAVYIIGGLYLITHPLLALGTLTLLLAAMLLAEAILRAVAYFQTRADERSPWTLVNAVVTFLLGGMIWRQWPSSSVWAIGTLVGINLLMGGTSGLMLRNRLRQIGKRLEVS